MSADLAADRDGNNPVATAWLVRRVALAVVVFLALPATLFGAAGRVRWRMGWAYVLVAAAVSLVSRLAMWWKTPDLVAERAGFAEREDAKVWDRVLMPILAILGPMVVLLVAGLDVRSRGPSRVPSWLQYVALGLVALGGLVGTWAMVANRFFSAVVRIQKERGHVVQTGGPYRYVRHPGYAGTIVAWLATGPALGSLRALVPAGLIASLYVLRTALEDRTLQAELEGYKEYAREVRCRLLPGVW